MRIMCFHVYVQKLKYEAKNFGNRTHVNVSKE